MIKKEIHYEDFNEQQQVEEAYFHLSKSELIEMEVGAEGGSLGTLLENLVKSGNQGAAVVQFREFIVRSYGVRSPDGSRFNKDPELTKKFVESPAFDALFAELATSEAAATEFVMGIVPKDLKQQVLSQAVDARPVETVQGTVSDEPAWVREDRDPTPAELKHMTQPQLMAAFQRKMSK